MAKKKPRTVTTTLRDAIEQSDESRYALSKRTGVGQDVLSHFMAGKQIRSDKFDVLCEGLNLELRKKGT